jgi:hypothetical protein
MVVQTLQSVPNTLGLAIDSRGRLLATARVSFSGPQPSVVRRFNTTTYAIEHEATVGLGAGSAADSGFHRALVVDPLSDYDNDGVANFDEVTGGGSGNPSAPYDAQSNLVTNLVVTGPNEQGGTVRVQALGQIGANMIIGVAAKRAVNEICLSAFQGCIRVDTAALTGFIFAGRVPYTLNIPLPMDPNLVGVVAYFQAIYDLGTTKPAWSNVDCVNVYK